MSDQPKPTGEWTPETVQELRFRDGNEDQNIADAHNAALVAAIDEAVDPAHQEILVLRQQLTSERELADIGRKWKSDSSLETWFPFTANEIQKLSKQLSAERRTRQEIMKVTRYDASNQQLREQLDVEREKVDWLKSQLKLPNDALSPAQQEIAQLREQLATAVEALKWLRSVVRGKDGRQTQA